MKMSKPNVQKIIILTIKRMPWCKFPKIANLNPSSIGMTKRRKKVISIEIPHLIIFPLELKDLTLAFLSRKARILFDSSEIISLSNFYSICLFPPRMFSFDSIFVETIFLSLSDWYYQLYFVWILGSSYLEYLLGINHW